MRSRKREAALDGLLEEYAIQHLEWPDSQEELDLFLSQDCGDDAYSVEETASRVQHVISRATPAADEEVVEKGPRQTMLFNADHGAPVCSHRGRAGNAVHEVVREAYLQVYEGCSIDRLIADPGQNARFVQACWKLGTQATQYELTWMLLNARKNGIIGKVPGVTPYRVPREVLDEYLFGSESALRVLQDREYFSNQRSVSLDQIICDPRLAQQFEMLASSIAAGYTSLDYRWAALTIRKARNRRCGKDYLPIPRFDRLGDRSSIRTRRIEQVPGFFWLVCDSADMYIGHAENLKDQIERMLDLRLGELPAVTEVLRIGNLRRAEYAIAPYPGVSASNREPVKNALVRSKEPRLNLLERGYCVA